MSTQPNTDLETFPNPNVERDYTIRIDTPEFTCLCPKTGQPDFGTINISYIPDKKCIELKSLKLYIYSYRDKGSFHEAVTNKILEDFVKSCDPQYVSITGDYNVRGGIKTIVTVEHKKTKRKK